MRKTMADMGNLWEDLRRQARQLENEIDLKLVSFSKLGTSYSTQRDYERRSERQNATNGRYSSSFTDLSSDTAPLLNKASSEHMFDTMAMEISQLLAKLTEVNDRMVEYTQNISTSSPSAALMHTLQRHRDILQDYSHEFQKTKANITAMREREDLLGSVRRDINAYKNSSSLNRRSDMYLKEHDHIRNSERLVDEQISIAIATKENLQSQGKFLNTINQKVNAFANRFPMINSLVQKINLRKRRDSIILGLVIAVCVILMILFTFH
ncbi:Golgi SNAP receptor complex member 1-like isoform X2 [Physella acuta]|uniref:Golgi SNAP receptor complex member 1-like isoform X2 n=1 Tax=Physella acuta TaxID=109671 RepID=UPI0027DE0A08|nr:Golgi SNAP receptor complex member 1-like isoform X2 [Physella acuta]